MLTRCLWAWLRSEIPRIDEVETRAEWAHEQITWDPMVLGSVWTYLWGLQECCWLQGPCSAVWGVGYRGQGHGADSLFLVQTARCPSVGRLYDLGKGRKRHHEAASWNHLPVSELASIQLCRNLR